MADVFIDSNLACSVFKVVYCSSMDLVVFSTLSLYLVSWALMVVNSYFSLASVLTKSTLVSWAIRVFSVTSLVIWVSPPGTSTGVASVGSPSSSSSSSAPVSPGRTSFFLTILATVTSYVTVVSPAVVVSVTFGFGAGTLGVFGFPVEVLLFLSVVTATVIF